MKIQFLGAARTVTGSCFYVETSNVRFLVECGAFQGPGDIEDRNYEPFPFNPADLDYVFLTHAHFDHCGRLPLLVKQGFKGRIVSTQPTRDLAKIVLLDSANLQKEEYERWLARPKNMEGSEQEQFKKPLYTEQDVEECMRLFEVYPYGTSVNITKECEFRMRDAGHILGSAIFEFWLENEAERKENLSSLEI
jgi:metallo-beta-lactamase family protein